MAAFAVSVSNADLNRFERQVADALSFLRANLGLLRAVRRYPGVQGMSLDFGVLNGSSPGQFFRLPEELVKEAARTGLSLELSVYRAATP